jgi:hypothetical protein
VHCPLWKEVGRRADFGQVDLELRLTDEVKSTELYYYDERRTGPLLETCPLHAKICSQTVIKLDRMSETVEKCQVTHGQTTQSYGQQNGINQASAWPQDGAIYQRWWIALEQRRTNLLLKIVWNFGPDYLNFWKFRAVRLRLGGRGFPLTLNYIVSG